MSCFKATNIEEEEIEENTYCRTPRSAVRLPEVKLIKPLQINK